MQSYTYEGATIEEAVERGLEELGLDRDGVDVEVKSRGGFFAKPTVVLTPKEAPVTTAEAEEAQKDTDVEEQTETHSKRKPTEAELVRAEERVRTFITALIGNMGLNCSVSVARDGEDISVNIEGDDAGSVIGYRGETLDAVQYVTLWIANEHGRDFVRVSVDAENYRQKRKEVLTALAERLAHKCHKTGRRVSLEPMNPFERRVIHTALQDDKFVRTESEGEGRFRHVVIIPKDEDTERKPREKVAETPEMTYGTSFKFRHKGAVKTKTYGAPKKRPY